MKFRMNWRGPEAIKRAESAARQGLDTAAKYVKEVANRTVPHEEGNLERSGDAGVHPVRLEAAVSYDTPYARVQHERLDFKHDPGRRAKWLELTMQEERAAVQRIIADHLKKALAE